MITKKSTEALIRKLVDERIAEHNKDDSETIEKMKKELGWHPDWLGHFGGLMPPFFSVHEMIEAIYEYFGLALRRTEKKTVALKSKIKKAK